jgi:hypothetical protein
MASRHASLSTCRVTSSRISFVNFFSTTERGALPWRKPGSLACFVYWLVISPIFFSTSGGSTSILRFARQFGSGSNATFMIGFRRVKGAGK